MSIAYLDPGNIESDLQSGTTAMYKVKFHSYRLIFVMTVEVIYSFMTLVPTVPLISYYHDRYCVTAIVGIT